ncbi:hypothetical protein WT83_04825 [Burkholderia territorii]|uniref:Pili assembly chaperone N-terminal domain-containing protein n=2 Tax=Burkholderia territorii TaxID=1503055 RepID=A0A108F2V5_9BURK|nr:hypothetical protein WT83_04825 [Burkholderia territorii]
MLVATGLLSQAHATGMLPDTPLLVISEKDGMAQMGLKNTDDRPLLLYTTVVDLPEDPGPELYALPSVTRVEAGQRQIVRFVLGKSAAPLTVQHLKRVRFEGIPAAPASDADKDKAIVRINVRQDIPAVISPSGLEQDREPWKRLQWSLSGHTLTISNPSPYVVRLSQQMDLLPAVRRVKLLDHTFILPGQKFSVQLPADTSPQAIRIFPASPYGFDVGSFDIPLSAQSSGTVPRAGSDVNVVAPAHAEMSDPADASDAAK